MDDRGLVEPQQKRRNGRTIFLEISLSSWSPVAPDAAVTGA
jgi:hypothetical protein